MSKLCLLCDSPLKTVKGRFGIFLACSNQICPAIYLSNGEPNKKTKALVAQMKTKPPKDHYMDIGVDLD